MLVSSELIKTLKRYQAELAAYEEPLRNSKREIENTKLDLAKTEAELQELRALLNSASRKIRKMDHRIKFTMRILESRRNIAKVI